MWNFPRTLPEQLQLNDDHSLSAGSCVVISSTDGISSGGNARAMRRVRARWDGFRTSTAMVNIRSCVARTSGVRFNATPSSRRVARHASIAKTTTKSAIAAKASGVVPGTSPASVANGTTRMANQISSRVRGTIILILLAQKFCPRLSEAVNRPHLSKPLRDSQTNDPERASLRSGHWNPFRFETMQSMHTYALHHFAGSCATVGRSPDSHCH